MLRLQFGEREDALKSGNGYFDHWLDFKLLLTDFSRKVIKEVDKSEVVSENLIQSPVLGPISPTMLSGGSKSLIILMYTDKVMKLSCMGDNCLPFLTDIAKEKDFTVNTDYFRDVFCGGLDKCYVINFDRIVTSREELLDEWWDAVNTPAYDVYFPKNV